MAIISKTVCEVVQCEDGTKRWIIREHDEEILIGEYALFGLPQAKNCDVGTKQTVILEAP
jgi:hypothetical protein